MKLSENELSMVRSKVVSFKSPLLVTNLPYECPCCKERIDPVIEEEAYAIPQVGNPGKIIAAAAVWCPKCHYLRLFALPPRDEQ